MAAELAAAKAGATVVMSGTVRFEANREGNTGKIMLRIPGRKFPLTADKVVWDQIMGEAGQASYAECLVRDKAHIDYGDNAKTWTTSKENAENYQAKQAAQKRGIAAIPVGSVPN